jgi:hypothetical protein
MSTSIYWIIYGIMLSSFLYLSMVSMPTLKEKAIGVLITMVNALLFLPKG